jgi:protein MpaA
VVESGDPANRTSVLVVGCIHGTERAGVAVTRRLIAAGPSSGEHLWIVDYLNPDGAAARTRVNARGVDLNRNFPTHWRPIGVPGDPQYSGPGPGSEPETRAAMRLIERIRPTVTIWFHQPVRIVRASGRSVRPALRFARRVGLTFSRLPWLSGSASNWQNNRFTHGASFVVELPPGPLPEAAVPRYARAVRAAGG